MAKDGSLKRSTISKIFTIIAVLLIAGVLGGFGYYFMQYRDTRKQLDAARTNNAELTKKLESYRADPSQAAQAEADKIIADVGKLYDLPKDEKPSVATVKDKEKLKDQPFFAKAENNDVTLIYSGAKLAILYRPSSNQIINVSSVTLQDNDASPPANR
jgi:hypothetical protein